MIDDESDRIVPDNAGAEVAALENTSELKFLVHVPKTAGSSINGALLDYNPNGVMHCESILNNKVALTRAANTSDWLTGHIDFTTASSALEAVTGRSIEYYACMRHPRAQVASHYNWLIEIFHKGVEFYENHPQRVKGISARIRASNNDSVDDIINNLQSFPGLFLNFQSRFILGRGFNWNSGKILQRLRNYTMVVDNKRARELTASMLDMNDFEFPNRNESAYHFDRSLFDHPLMIEFLSENNTLDEILYRIICDISVQQTKQSMQKPEPVPGQTETSDWN